MEGAVQPSLGDSDYTTYTLALGSNSLTSLHVLDQRSSLITTTNQALKPEGLKTHRKEAAIVDVCSGWISKDCCAFTCVAVE